MQLQQSSDATSNEAEKVAISIYRHLTDNISDLLSDIERAAKFTIDYQGGLTEKDQVVFSGLKQVKKYCRVALESLQDNDLANAKKARESAKNILTKMLGKVGDLDRSTEKTAIDSIKNAVLRQDRYTAFSNTLEESLSREFSSLHRQLGDLLVDSEKIKGLEVGSLKRMVSRYLDIIQENKVNHPAEVEAFLEKVNDYRTTATLADLSAEVLEYLQHNGLASGCNVGTAKR